MFSVSFYLLTPKAKSYSSLYASIISNKQRLRFPTGEKLPAEFCNIRKKKGKDLVKKNTALYFDLDTKVKTLKKAFFEIHYELLSKGLDTSPQKIRDVYFERTNPNKIQSILFIDVLKKYITSDAVKNSCSESTMKIYRTLSEHLKNFEEAKGFKLDAYSVNYEFWEAFKSYMAYDLKQLNPTVNKYLGRLKQILSYANDEIYFPNPLPLKKLKEFEELHTHDMPTIALSEEELEVLYNLDLSANERLEKIRDLFLIECYTGQRYSDLESVMDLENTFKNEIIIYQGKTNARVCIPLTKKLCEHLEKIHLRYKGKKIPVISNQKFNDYLKELGQVAGFETNIKMLKLSGKNKIESNVKKWELLTTHTGRRTFCTYSLQRGIPAEVIMRVSGHKSYEVFRKYIRLDQTAIQKEFNDKF